MQRRAIVVHGIVQGVGFRPFVYHLARRLGLCGFVKNQTGSVLIEVEGEDAALERFLTELSERPPPLAQIERTSWRRVTPRGEGRFRVEPSETDPSGPVFISPDVATCPDCLAELFDPADRRHRYPFINCTNCGPRLTIITGAPYDRPLTTMASFAMCAACRAEYDDPADRRFHAQPIACADCGPRLSVLDGTGKQIVADPLEHFAAALRAGNIGAMKGLGGYHLVCDARGRAAVAELRRRKHRDEKPFAVMVADVAAAEVLCEVNPAERDLLRSPRAPIVLLRRRSLGEVAEEVAPGNLLMGVMLPYTPPHHLLFRALAEGTALVMTSGNRSDEPIAYRDDEALAKLNGIADLFLVHDRPIHVRCDDSVTRVVAGKELPLRRSRGYAPRPIELPFECPVPILAVGGQLKATFALGRGRQAFLSHHLGDLDHHEAFEAFVKDVALYEELFAIRPECLAHDLHPDYATTHHAQQRAAREGVGSLGVQHHHAHLASCMAEHGLSGPVIGVTFDGTGHGSDGAVWGGEFLVGDYRTFERVAHLRYVGMPGGDQAIREPWRMAVAHLKDAGVTDSPVQRRRSAVELRVIERMLERSVNTPLTSSAGRLFDAVASLAAGRDHVSYEGQAAVELEWLATGLPPAEPYPFEVRNDGSPAALVVDTRPLIRTVAEEASEGIGPSLIARRFHSTLVEIIAVVSGRIRQRTGIAVVVFSGGVFLNALLTSEAETRLHRDGFEVYRHHLVPPGDGGLSLGQLAIAADTLRQERCR